MFILAEKVGFGDVFEYYAGKTYVVQHEYYPWITSNSQEAKAYTSKVRAENACEKLNTKVGRNFKVIAC